MKPLTLIVLFFVLSCVEDVDFTQADNVSIFPSVENSFLYFNLIATDLLDASNNEISGHQEHLIEKLLDGDVVQDNLIKIEFYFEVTNSFNRSFLIDVNFYNALDELQYSINLNESESPLNDLQTNEYTIIVEGTDLAAVKTTTKIEAAITLLPSNNGNVLEPTSSGNLEFKSKVISSFEFNSNN